MSEIEMEQNGIEQSQAVQPGTMDTATPADVQEQDQEEQDQEEQAQEEQDAQEPVQEPQTAAVKSDGLVRLMDPSGISMRVFSRNLIGDYALKDLTGEKNLKVSELEERTKRGSKEPKFEAPASGIYNFEYIQSAMRSLKSLGVSYIKIEISKDQVIKISAVPGEGMHEVWYFYLAPYMEE